MAKIKKGFKYRIYPTAKQAELINKTIDCSRFIWNYALGRQKVEENYWYLTEELVQSGMLSQNNWKGKFYSATEAQSHLKELKKNHPFLKEADSIALQATLQDLGTAYTRFFDKLGGKPKFKRKKDAVPSYTT